MRAAHQCFNPHPPLLAGETAGYCPLPGAFDVSIHTRHYWRVKLERQRWRHRIDNRFNPHPPLLAGETRWRGSGAMWVCFNPHPPLLAGETKEVAQ